MKLSDYIADWLAKQGVKQTFVVSGGAAVHMIDSIARHPGIDYVCAQHEESEAMAADAYARVTGNLGVGVTTSGPGGTNLLTGVCCSYFDSIPTLFLTGQVARWRLKPSQTMRQMGFQETDMVSIYKSVAKYAEQVTDPAMIRFELEKAVYMARQGRPGPVLLDIPDDLQREDIDPETLMGFTPEQPVSNSYAVAIKELMQLVGEASRPVLVFGAGIRIAQVEEAARKLVDKLQLPFLLTWGAMDIWPYDHKLNAGGFGVCGPRAGNFVVQNSDLIVGIGTRFSQMLTGGKLEHFGRAAKKVMIDIDKEELTKFRGKGLELDLAIQADLRELLPQWLEALDGYSSLDLTSWREKVVDYKNRFPIARPEDYEQKEEVDANVFIDALSEMAKEGDIVITDAGGNLTWTMQGFKVKEGQRLFSAWNHSPMAYSLGAAYGAAKAAPDKDVICIIGDGGLQMCAGELATIARYNLSVKIFVFNNQGHGIQKQTIETWLEGRYEALDYESGLLFPDFVKLAEAYGLPAVSISNHEKLHEQIKRALGRKGPVLIDVAISPDQRIKPMLTFGRPLEDQAPPLDRVEFKRNMIIDPLPESLKKAEETRV